LALLAAAATVCTVPLIGSGGPSKPQHVVDAFEKGNVDAFALGTLLHFKLSTVADVRSALQHAFDAARASEKRPHRDEDKRG
jgi:imidazole glycerol-phosphate synthase subunit HisF